MLRQRVITAFASTVMRIAVVMAFWPAAVSRYRCSKRTAVSGVRESLSQLECAQVSKWTVAQLQPSSTPAKGPRSSPPG